MFSIWNSYTGVIATYVILGGTSRQKSGRTVREVGREARSSKTRDRRDQTQAAGRGGKRKRVLFLSEGAGTARKAQCGEGEGVGGQEETVKKGDTNCPQRQRNQSLEQAMRLGEHQLASANATAKEAGKL